MKFSTTSPNKLDIALLRAQFCEYQARINLPHNAEEALEWVEKGIVALDAHDSAVADHHKGLLHITASTVWGQHMQDFAQALRNAETGLHLLPDSATPAQLSGLINLGIIYIHTGKLAQGKHHLEKAIHVANLLGDKARLAATHINLGIVERRLGNWEYAITHQRKASDIYAQLGDTNRQGSAYVNLGMIFYMRSQDDDAQQVLTNALDLASTYGLSDLMGFANTTLAKVYIRAGKLEEAKELLHLARNDARERRVTSDAMPSILYLLAKVNQQEHLFPTALDLATQSISVAQEGHYLQEEGIAWSIKGEILDSLHRFDEAEEAHQTALSKLHDQEEFEHARGQLSYARHQLKRQKETPETCSLLIQKAYQVFHQLGASHELAEIADLAAAHSLAKI